MLASDFNNPEFAGAKDPDAVLSVEFYDFAALDKWETDKTGIKTYLPECPYVRISIPGNQNNVVETPAGPWHAQRFPRQWLAYQMSKGMIANADDVPGWKIEEWPELNPEQARKLRFLRFTTVEQIAGASDAQVQGIGMDGPSLKAKAQKAIALRNGQQVQSEISKRDQEIAELKEKLNQVLEMVGEKRKPGRPRNDEREAA